MGPWTLNRISISTQLLFWFLGISLIPCGVLTALISYNATKSLKKSVRQGLLAIADAKTAQLESFVRERRADMNMASRTTALVESMPRLSEARRKEPLDSPVYIALTQPVRHFVQNFVSSFGYSNAYLFDTDGTLLFQLKSDLDLGSNILTGPLKESELAEVFDRVRTLLQSEVSDYQMYSGHSEPAAFIATPVFGSQGRILGFMAFELENGHVFQVFKEYSGLGETGEAMVAMRQGQEFTYVAPPRYSPDAAFKYRGRFEDVKATAMQKAVEGQRGYGEGVDYQGHPVVAAWSYLPSYRWGMVVKQDVDEAFALVNQERTMVLSLLAVTSLLVIAIALDVAGNYSADPGGCPGNRTGGLRRSHSLLRVVGTGGGRIAVASNRQDDRRPSLADRQDSAIEHHTSVDCHRDRGNIPAAGTSRFRLQRFDQPGCCRSQRDLGHRQ